ncbi:MAG: small multi-drug export protein [Gemmatimonadota bacterium]|nr:small multi-drug export protein [Gemmatimonadota bacterium]
MSPLATEPNASHPVLQMPDRAGAEMDALPAPTEAGKGSSDAFPPLPLRVQRALTVGPLLGFGLILLVTGWLLGWEAAGFMTSVAAGTFLGGGKLVILAGAVEQAPVGHWTLAALVVYIDLATALIVMGGMHVLYRLPGAGRRIRAARQSGWRLLQQNAGMHRVTWLSLAGFVAVPLNGTGALVGAIVGRLLGLSRVSIVSAIAFGSVVGSGALALAGGYWSERINALAARPWLGLVVVAIVLGSMLLASRWATGGSNGGEEGR